MKANNIIFSLNHISPKRNNIHSPGTSVDATRHTEGKAVLNVVVAAASAAAAVVVVAVRQTDAQNGCLVGGWVGWLRRRRKKKKNGGGGDADVDDGEGFPNSIYTNSRSTASAAATGTTNTT